MAKVRVAINGFGRIGRLVFQALCDQGLLGKAIDVVAVVDISTDADYFAYQMKYDSVHGKFKHPVTTEKSDPSKTENDMLVVNGHKIKCLMATKDPSQLPWKDLKVDYVIESTGLFTDSEKAKGHLAAGAKKVIISAPGKGEVKTLLMGVNENEYDSAKHHIVSNASCTTNCLAPLVPCAAQGRHRHRDRPDDHHPRLHRHPEDRGRPLQEGLARRPRGGDQHHPLLHRRRQGRRRSAARDQGQAHRHVVPRRHPGRVGGRSDLPLASRTPRSRKSTPSSRRPRRPTSRTSWAYCDEELVSTDFIHDPRSSIYDSLATVQNNLKGEKRFFKLVSWYDNEWGYSNRVVDLVKFMAKKDGIL